MDLFPPNADEKLGFSLIRERLLELVMTPYGRQRVIKSRASSELEHVRLEVGCVAEVQSAITFDDPIPIRSLDDVWGVISAVGPEDSYVSGPDLLLIRQVLETLRLTVVYWRRRPERYPLVVARSASVSEVPAVEEAIERVIDERGEVRDDASAELRRIRREIVRRQGQLRETLQRELRSAAAHGYAVEEQPTVRGGRMVIPIRAEARRRIAGFVHDTSASGQTVYLEPAACLDLNNEVRELESAERQEVLRLLRETTGLVRRHLTAIRQGIEFLGWFDFTCARARLAIELDAVRPEVNVQFEVSLKEARNPALVLLFHRLASGNEVGDGERLVVPLELNLSDQVRTIVITGPNAGGKTVAMKTVGLMCLMLGHGIPVPVHPASSLCLFKRVLVDIGDEQSIEEDLSTFSSHVSNLSYMLSVADEGTLVLIDEAGTGTDPQEGAALARAVLESLTASGARTIATTHHGALKAYAHETARVENASMAFDEESLKPTYEFRTGIPGSSYAFPISRRQGLPDSVLERASELAGTQQSSFENLLSDFQARTIELNHKIEEVEVARGLAEDDRRRLADRLEELQAGRAAVKAQALREAEAVLAEANARVESTIREIREAQAERETTRLTREQLEDLRETIRHKRERMERRGGRRGRSVRSEAGRIQSDEIRPGDQVVVDEGLMAGEVMEIQGRTATLNVGSNRLRADLSRLRKVGTAAVKRRASGARRESRSVSQDRVPALEAHASIDLRGHRVAHAVPAVIKLIDDAVSANLDQVEVLHGTGTGALRSAVREALDQHPSVSAYEDAPWDRGGPGVTLVHLR